MPLMLPTGCEYGNCKAYAVHGTRYCEKHTKLPETVAPAASKKSPWAAWYHRFPWTGPNGLRHVVLARDPVCKVCNHYPSTIADHIIPHKGNWTLFVSLNNLQGICEACHNSKTASEDGGFGNVAAGKAAPAITGEEGKQFSSGSHVAAQDKALEDIDALLDVQLPESK